MVDLGNVQVSSIYFGSLKLDGGSMFGVVPRAIWQRWQEPDSSNRLKFAMRGLLILDENRKIIVDAGAGDKYSVKDKQIYEFEEPEGGIIGELSHHNLKVEDITDVIITHLHFDHAGGVTYFDGSGELKLRFPNAQHIIQAKQIETAKNPNPHEISSIFKENWELPLTQSKIVTGEVKISEHVKVVPSDGHTRGMQTVWVEGSKNRLVFLADLIPTAAHLPIAYTMSFDLNIEKIMVERKTTIKKIIDDKYIAVFEHDPFIIGSYLKMGKKHAEILTCQV